MKTGEFKERYKIINILHDLVPSWLIGWSFNLDKRVSKSWPSSMGILLFCILDAITIFYLGTSSKVSIEWNLLHCKFLQYGCKLNGLLIDTNTLSDLFNEGKYLETRLCDTLSSLKAVPEMEIP